MDLFLAILLCKILRILLKIFGKGSSFPGQIVLKLFPNVLKKVKLPKYIIVVTGSNGKTSSVELINNVLTNNGFKVAYNFEGSNQIEGVTTLVLNDCSLSGKCKSDILLLEVDERYAKQIFNNIVPTHVLVTNLFRDQQTRNGNREWVYNCIKESIKKESCLILNANDPLTSSLSEYSNNSVYYAIGDVYPSPRVGVFDDGKYCPKCGGKLIYKYRLFDNLGSFECESCGHKMNNPKYTITNIDLDNSRIFIDNSEVMLTFPSIYNAYNILAAYAIGCEVGIEKESVIKSLNNYVLKNRRIVKLSLNNKNGIFLASKHENPVSYNQSLSYISNYKNDSDVIIVVDRISRKYFTSETSWLWDIDFDILISNNVKNVILSGKYAYDLALRFDYSNVDPSKIKVCEDIDKAIDTLANIDNNNFFVVTCFADQDNVLGKVKQHG